MIASFTLFSGSEIYSYLRCRNMTTIHYEDGLPCVIINRDNQEAGHPNAINAFRPTSIY